MKSEQATSEASSEKSSSAVKISVVTATMIAIADMVGIGVFTSLGYQVIDITSGFSLILLWTLGGIVALCGALCYAELAAAFPRSGGEYNFLSRTYHNAVGFMSGWISATVGFAAPVAVAAIAFGKYFNGVIPDSPVLALGLGIVWFITFLHLSGIQHSIFFQNISTIIKIGLILALIVAGFAFGTPQEISFVPQDIDFSQHIFGAAFAVSLVYVMYSYSGWNASTYIIDEIDDPKHTLPRSIIIATLAVTVLYIALNAVFLYTTPIDKMAGQTEVALIAGKHIFGDSGGALIAGLICFGLLSTISAMTWIGPRVTVVMGEDFSTFRIFSKKLKNGVPAYALLLQTSIVTVLLLTQTFESIVNYIQFSLTLSSFLTVLGVIVLRFTQPDLPRPYKTWGYPITPIIFLGVTFWMMAYLLLEKTTESLAGLATIIIGFLVYVISAKQKSILEPAREV